MTDTELRCFNCGALISTYWKHRYVSLWEALPDRPRRAFCQECRGVKKRVRTGPRIPGMADPGEHRHQH